METFFNAIRRIGFHRGPGRMLGGICGGLADKTGVSAGLVRLLMLIAFLLPGIGVAAYMVVWVLTPWTDGSIPLERFLTTRGSHGGDAGQGPREPA